MGDRTQLFNGFIRVFLLLGDPGVLETFLGRWSFQRILFQQHLQKI